MSVLLDQGMKLILYGYAISIGISLENTVSTFTKLFEDTGLHTSLVQIILMDNISKKNTKELPDELKVLHPST